MRIKKGKAVFIATILPVIGIVGGVAWYNIDNKSNEAESVIGMTSHKSVDINGKEAIEAPESDIIEPSETEIPTVEAPEPVYESVPEDMTSEPVVKTETTIEPVKSIQEYAEMYLDLSGQHQSCFDMIVSKYPERFNESVRRQNIKALTVFAGVCGTGILPGAGHDYLLGGAFFDGELAKTTR